MKKFFKLINQKLSQMPSALSGLSLAIGSLGLCWDNVANLHGFGGILAAIVAGTILVFLYLKYLMNARILLQDLQHPIVGSVIPTLAMSTMVFASNISPYYFDAARVISWFAIFLHVIFFGYFTFYRFQHFKFTDILPSWFIPPIGLVLPVITHPSGLPLLLAESFLILGLVSYLLLLPIVLYRLLFCAPLKPHEKPILVILATPASLLLLGYLVVMASPNDALVIFLLVLSLAMTFYVYSVFKELLRLPFMPSYSAFTFPLVVGAIALFKTNQFLLDKPFLVWGNAIGVLAYIELVIASAMVCYVTLRYLHAYGKGAV